MNVHSPSLKHGSEFQDSHSRALNQHGALVSPEPTCTAHVPKRPPVGDALSFSVGGNDRKFYEGIRSKVEYPRQPGG